MSILIRQTCKFIPSVRFANPLWQAPHARLGLPNSSHRICQARGSQPSCLARFAKFKQQDLPSRPRSDLPWPNPGQEWAMVQFNVIFQESHLVLPKKNSWHIFGVHQADFHMTFHWTEPVQFSVHMIITDNNAWWGYFQPLKFHNIFIKTFLSKHFGHLGVQVPCPPGKYPAHSSMGQYGQSGIAADNPIWAKAVRFSVFARFVPNPRQPKMVPAVWDSGKTRVALFPWELYSPARLSVWSFRCRCYWFFLWGAGKISHISYMPFL